MITIDFETYSDAGFGPATVGLKGIAGVGAYMYSKHPSTRVLVLAYAKKVWLPGMDYPVELLDHISKGGLIEAHNSLFEYWIWNNVCTRLYGWPHIPLAQFRDSMPKASAYGLPAAMGNISKTGLLKVKKMESGKGLINKFSVPTLHKGSPADFCEFTKYCMNDVATEENISHVCPDLSPEEQKVWELDQIINTRGVCLDYTAIKDSIKVVEKAVKAGNIELASLTGGKVNTVGQTKAMGEWLETRGLVLPLTKKGSISLTSAVVSELLPQTEGDVKRVLELRRDLSLASVQKLFTMEKMLDPSDNRIRGIFRYYGAGRTGRWTGQGVQPQNLKRPDSVGVMEQSYAKFSKGEGTLAEVSKSLRGLFVAGSGMELISSDYSAIEAVVLAELSNEPWRKEVFRTHGKIYEMSASKITHLPFEEFERYKEEHGKHHPYRSSIGKLAELASGYGGWINAWKAFGAGEHFKNDNEIKSKIVAWRNESPNIVELWGGQVRKNAHSWVFKPELYGAEGAVVKAIGNPGESFPIGLYISAVVDPVRDVLKLVLPSGRCLYYQQPRLTPHIGQYSGLCEQKITFASWEHGPRGWHRAETYGGRLVENITQAVARDLLAFALLNIERHGYPVVMHIHDEIVSEVPKGFGSVEEFERVMSEVPPWAEGWPVRASGGWRGHRYRK